MQFAQGKPRPQSSNALPMPRRRGPLADLRVETSAPNTHIALAVSDSSASTSALSSAASEDYSLPFGPVSKPRSTRNMKKLSLTLPSAHSSTNSLTFANPAPPSEDRPFGATDPDTSTRVGRRASVLSLPACSTGTGLLHRKDEDGSPSAPYLDGPIEILPGVWLGSEDNARDWKELSERNITAILNVAKEVVSPFDSANAQPMRPFQSTPNPSATSRESRSTFYPAQLGSERPAMHYLKLKWSHGQADLVKAGFPEAMAFVDATLLRNEGVLIHCQCGISRSATLVIALVMRAAATSSTSVPQQVWELKGMQGAYAFVKSKSKWVGPNMSLIYQLLEYERTLKAGNASPAMSDRSSRAAADEVEWGRRRQMLDEEPPCPADDETESAAVMHEAQALDKAMEDRVEKRKSIGSVSSIASSSNGVGMGPAWRSRYSGRKRTGSVASNGTNVSVLSEDLVEEDEEPELLGVGRKFHDDGSIWRSPSTEEEESSSASNSPEDANNDTTRRPLPLQPRRKPAPRPPPSAPAHQTSFTLPPLPATAVRSSFQHSTRVDTKARPRPVSASILPPVPPSPPSIYRSIVETQAIPTRKRKESRKPAPPPLHLRSTTKPQPPNTFLRPPTHAQMTSQTLFVFPPSPNNARTPSTMTLTSNLTTPVPFPSLSTPRVATFRSHGRTRSYIGVGAPPTPTTACSRVDARGWVGKDKEK